jgi:hypothetical protein
MGITFKSLLDALPYVTAIHKPIMLRARHGVGKSCVVYQYAKSISKPVIERRVSQMTEGDTIGLPHISEKGTEWILPDFLVRACNEPVVLFFDELDRGTQEVRQSIFELCDSHKIAGHALHPETIIFAAINGGESGSQYQVGELDPAELDRWTVFDCEPSVEDWLSWAKDVVHPLIWDFINGNHQHLEHNADFEPNKVYPSRRSWHRFSDCLQQGAKNLLKQGTISPTIANLANAFIGLEGSVAFCDFVKNYQFQVAPEDILDKGEFERVKDFQINDHLALVEKFGSIFKGTATGLGLVEPNKSASKKEKDAFKAAAEVRVKNLAIYFQSLPSEISMKLLDLCAAADPQIVISLHRQDGVSAYLQRILTADGDKLFGEKKEEEK